MKHSLLIRVMNWKNYQSLRDICQMVETNKYNFFIVKHDLLLCNCTFYVIVHLTSPKRALNEIAQINNFSCVRFAHFSTFNTCLILRMKLNHASSFQTMHHSDLGIVIFIQKELSKKLSTNKSCKKNYPELLSKKCYLNTDMT